LELLVGQELAGFWSFQPSGLFVAFAAMACLISGLATGLLPLKALRNADPQQLLTFPSHTQRTAMGTGLADFSLLAQVAFSMVLCRLPDYAVCSARYAGFRWGISRFG
jgi:predicted lysophospholipase L1 biosynthesis ABC-type transport system permease subunit